MMTVAKRTSDRKYKNINLKKITHVSTYSDFLNIHAYMTGDQFNLSSDQFLMTILDIFLSILFFSMTSLISV